MLKASDREKLQDCLLLVQSANNILSGLRETFDPEVEDVRKCFVDANRTLTALLRA